MRSTVIRKLLYQLTCGDKNTGSRDAAEYVQEINKLVADNAELVKALAEAIPFIGYQASVEDIKGRCYAALADAGRPYRESK